MRHDSTWLLLFIIFHFPFLSSPYSLLVHLMLSLRHFTLHFKTSHCHLSGWHAQVNIFGVFIRTERLLKMLFSWDSEKNAVFFVQQIDGELLKKNINILCVWLPWGQFQFKLNYRRGREKTAWASVFKVDSPSHQRENDPEKNAHSFTECHWEP